jgi:hypothetical protein
MITRVTSRRQNGNESKPKLRSASIDNTSRPAKLVRSLSIRKDRKEPEPEPEPRLTPEQVAYREKCKKLVGEARDALKASWEREEEEEEKRAREEEERRRDKEKERARAEKKAREKEKEEQKRESAKQKETPAPRHQYPAHGNHKPLQRRHTQGRDNLRDDFEREESESQSSCQ